MSGTLRTIAGVVSQARAILQDTDSLPSYRYTDQDMIDAFNDGMIEVKAKRPDFFIDLGIRNPLPIYSTSDIVNEIPFPLDEQCYAAFVYYVAGRCELREDEYTDDGRAVALMNKFVAQITTQAS